MTWCTILDSLESVLWERARQHAQLDMLTQEREQEAVNFVVLDSAQVSILCTMLSVPVALVH